MKKQIFTGELIGEVPEAVIVAMGPLLCHLNPNELQLMFQTPGTFMHVIPIIGNMMRDCEMECLSKFAKLAVAFMDTPDLWTSDMVALLGPIPAGTIFFYIFFSYYLWRFFHIPQPCAIYIKIHYITFIYA